MDLQNNAAEHIGLRHRDFKKLCLANFLFALYVYMLLPVLPLWMTEMTELSRFQMSSVMAAFGVGVFSLGAFSSYLIQRYRRNKVCIQIFERFLNVVGTMEGTRIWEAHHEKKDAVDPSGNGEV